VGRDGKEAVQKNKNGGNMSIEKAVKEAVFQANYKKYAKEHKLDPNPDDPRHYYDYRGLYNEVGGLKSDKMGHLPSKFKKKGHPRMIIDGVNTKTGKKVKK